LVFNNENIVKVDYHNAFSFLAEMLLIALVLFFFLLVGINQPVLATNFSLLYVPNEVFNNQEFWVEIYLEISPNTTYYLRPCFYSLGSSAYFGCVKVAENWVCGSQADKTVYFPITTDGQGIWRGQILVKADSDKTGEFNFKVRRYTAAGSDIDSNTVIINLSQPSLSIDPTPSSIISPTFLPTLVVSPSPLQPTNTPMPTILPSPTLYAITPTKAVITTLTPTKAPTPSASAKATYQINEVKNEKEEALSSVKIYVDDQYTHHYAPEVLEFCDACFCDSEKKVTCGFGEHTIRLEKNGYQDWEETKTIEAGNSYLVNPVMLSPLTLTPASTPTPTPTLKAKKEENLLPTITSFLLSPNFSPSPFLFLNNFSLLPKKLVIKEEKKAIVGEAGQVLGEQEEKEKKPPDWYFVVGAFYLGASGWRLSRKDKDDDQNIIHHPHESRHLPL